MAGYPYNGGVYGGYSDPANNKKKTFIGQSADKALSTLPSTIKANPDAGASTVSDAGSMARTLLQKTPGGYPNVGLSTPPAAKSPARDMLLNIPGDNGQPWKSPLAKAPAPSLTGKAPTYALNATGAATNPLASGMLGNKSLRAGRELVTPSNQVTDAQSGMLGQGGIRYDKQADGSTTYSMGKRGDGNYASLNRQPVNALARQALVSGGQQTRDIGGLTVTGSQDAVSKLAAPVGTYDRNSPEYNQAQAQNYQKANPFSQNNPYDDRFSYRPPQGSDIPLIAPPPVAMGGGGWKSRIEADRSNAAAYGDYARALSSLQGAAVQERGANYRAGLQQQGVVEQNDIARQRLMGEQGFNDARIKTEGINQQKGQMEVDQAKKVQAARDEFMKNPTPENETKYRGAIGKFEKEAQYGTIGRYDDQGMKTGEDLYNKQTGELVRRDDNERLYSLPPNPKELVEGRIYQTGKGVGRWDGKNFDLRWYDRDVQQPRPPAAPVQPSTGQLMP